MAEIVAVVASVGTLAEYGFKLSLQLFTYSQAVATADRSIRDMSNEVSLTSAVLQQLSSILKSDGQVASTTALDATYRITRECDGVFRELGMILEPSLAGLGDGDLTESKATLTLMLQVLGYAKDVANQQLMTLKRSHMERHMGEKGSAMQDMTASDIESPMQYPQVTTEPSTVFSSASVASAEAIEKTSKPLDKPLSSFQTQAQNHLLRHRGLQSPELSVNLAYNQGRLPASASLIFIESIPTNTFTKNGATKYILDKYMANDKTSSRSTRNTKDGVESG
ncbi:hypothetical protein SUNI508_02321 [Seiridium unicorne]|uniref:Fungal N-terminal domain-containing protein n=1 Tax=Seiridium unicorne TaxID=138068 RepID=A0ABR2UI81_9PEZI